MLMSLFLKGWIIGFSIAMPLGPIGILCLQHSLMRGLMYGLAAGFGVALADAVYGGIAGFGINIISNIVIQNQILLELIGALFLGYLGFNILRSKPNLVESENNNLSLFRVFITMFMLTLTNPMTVLCFVGAFAGLGVCSTTDAGFHTSLMLTSGVLMGSLAWWVILSLVVALLGSKIKNISFYKWFNRISGSLILIFAFIATLHVIYRL